jgi:RNA polymerase sigma factor (sigma-70 family)
VATREERFRAIFDAALPALTSYARRRVPVDEVDDLVADVLLVAWRRLDDVPSDSPLPWLYGVARNVQSNRARGERRRYRLVEAVAAQPPRTPDLDGGDTPITRAFAALPARDREVLALAAWEGLGAAEIATVLGCTSNAAALRLCRARNRLRHALTGSGDVRTETRVEGRRA